MQYKVGDQVFGNWKLMRLIGEGSFGKVYEAQREDFGRAYKAAIKIITIPQSESELQSVQADGLDDESVTSYFRGFVEELVDEFALMSDLKGHSNIVSYEDHTVVPHTDGIGWDIMIRMELLTPLIQHIRTNTMTQRDIIRLGIDLCKALELCQKYKIIHRDIKPENIFISPAGDFKLGDFGIASTADKSTSGMSKKGTYTYMAPEIYRDQPYGTTVDIYSLGIVLYWLLNENRSPFLPAYPATITHSDRERALRNRMGGEAIPAPKNADGRLAEIVLKACAYNPKERYSSPVQMRQELEAILYNQREAAVIFLGGDGLPTRSVHEIPTDETVDATESAFSPKQSRQQAPAEEADKTESVFGATASERLVGPFETVEGAEDAGEQTESVFLEKDENAGISSKTLEMKERGNEPAADISPSGQRVNIAGSSADEKATNKILVAMLAILATLGLLTLPFVINGESMPSEPVETVTPLPLSTNSSTVTPIHSSAPSTQASQAPSAKKSTSKTKSSNVPPAKPASTPTQQGNQQTETQPALTPTPTPTPQPIDVNDGASGGNIEPWTVPTSTPTPTPAPTSQPDEDSWASGGSMDWWQ